MNNKTLTSKSSLKDVIEYVSYYVNLKHTGNIRIEFSLLNGGITRIKGSVDSTLFPAKES